MFIFITIMYIKLIYFFYLLYKMEQQLKQHIIRFTRGNAAFTNMVKAPLKNVMNIRNRKIHSIFYEHVLPKIDTLDSNEYIKLVKRMSMFYKDKKNTDYDALIKSINENVKIGGKIDKPIKSLTDELIDIDEDEQNVVNPCDEKKQTQDEEPCDKQQLIKTLLKLLKHATSK